MSLLENLRRQGLRLKLDVMAEESEGTAPIHAFAVEQAEAERWNVVEARIDAEGIEVLAAYTLDNDRELEKLAADLPPDEQERFLSLVPDSRKAICPLLDIPDVPQVQLEQMVALRLEVELPFPAEESTWVCTRLPERGDAVAPVVLLAANTQDIDATKARLKAEGLQAAETNFAPAALIELADGQYGAGDSIAVARIEAGHALFAVGCDGAISYARHMRLQEPDADGNGASDRWAAALARELKQCLLDYTMRTGFPAPEKILVTGDAMYADGQLATLQRHQEITTGLLDLPETIRIGDDGPEAREILQQYPVPAGALLSRYRVRQGLPVAAPALQRVRSRGPLALKRSTWTLLAVNVLLVVALITSIFVVQSVRLTSADRFLRESKATVTELESMQEEVDILRYEERQRTTVLDILLALGEVFPPELKVETLNLDTQGKLVIAGTTKSVEAVSDGVTEALKKSTLFKNPEFKGATQGKGGFGFTLTCELATGMGRARR